MSVAPRSPSAQRQPQAQPQVVLGEVVTDLLNTSEPLPLDSAKKVLELVPGLDPEWRQHPVPFVASPDRFFGVDCRIPAGRAASPRGIGTVRVRAVLTAGHVLQGSARAGIVVGASTRRRPWAHYAANVGVIETINNVDPKALVDGFLKSREAAGQLNLAGLASYGMALLRDAPQLDGMARLRTRTSRLLWAVEVRDVETPDADIWTDGGDVFHARFVAPLRLVPQIAEFCEILALHDWLLSALKLTFDRANRSARPMAEFDPGLSHLGHVWNPAAHLPVEMVPLWEALERDAQLTWEWQTTLTRIRDNVSLLTQKAIEATAFREFM